MDKTSIDPFINSDMAPKVRMLAHFSHTDSYTIKAFADSLCSENLHRLQNCDSLWYFWYCLFLMLTLTCCLSQFYWTLLLCWILQSCYWISSLFPTLSTSSTVFCVSNFDVKLSFSLCLSHCFLDLWLYDRKAPGHCWSHQLTECCPTSWGSLRKYPQADRSAGRYVQNEQHTRVFLQLGLLWRF